MLRSYHRWSNYCIHLLNRNKLVVDIFLNDTIESINYLYAMLNLIYRFSLITLL